MCGRFTSTSSIEDLATCFDVEDVRTEALPARWNVAPTDPVLAIATRPSRPEPDRQHPQADGPTRALGRFRWGLVPSWAADLSGGARMINARAETVATKPAFRSALARRRCVIPADAFYEWQVLEATDRRGRPLKQPWAIRLVSGDPMAFAGLWEVWRDPNDPEAETVRTCAIVTTEANDALRPIHERMPVVLDRAGWDRWLDPTVETPDDLLGPAPSSWFETATVSTLVNDVRRDGPELLEPAAPVEPEAPALF